MLFTFVFHLYKVLQSFIDVFGKIYGWRAKLSHGNCYQFVQSHFYQIIKQFIAPLKMECSMNYIAVTKRLPSGVEQMQFGKKYTLLEGCSSCSFTQGCFFKMTPAGHPPLFNRIFFIIFLLFLLFNNYPFIPNGMLFFRNLKHLSLCGQSSWPGSGCDQVPRNNSEGFVCDMFLLCCWSLPFIQWKGRQPSPDVIC